MGMQIAHLGQIEDGKRYFLLQAKKSGDVSTGIVRAKVTWRCTGGSKIPNQMDIVFEMESGDLIPGPHDCDYIATVD